MIVQAVMVILQESTQIQDALQTLNQPGFVDRLLHFDRKNIDPKILDNLKNYTYNFNFRTHKLPSAIKALYLWVKFIEDYHELSNKTNPL